MSQKDEVIDYLRAQMASGALGPGVRLPSEATLCTTLGVSRGPLREALRELEGFGLVEARRGSGTYVSDMRIEHLMRGLAFVVDVLPLDSLLELIAVRRVLEAEAAARAAAAADAESATVLERLRTLVDRMDTETDTASLHDLDAAFHATVCDLGGNSALAAIVATIRSRGRHYDIYRGHDVRDESNRGHRDVLTAIERRDPTAAAAAMTAHIARTEHWLRDTRPVPNHQR